jgi:polar amino acid transport system ATP-binding protein
MLKVTDISYSYDGEHPALDNVTFDFAVDEIFAILGESGSGKTTLLRLLGRFLEPQTGSITYDGTDIRDIPEHVFRNKLGIVFQQLHLFPHLTVRENMTLALKKVMKKSAEDADSEALTMLERLSISNLADTYPGQISGGQAQRAAIARGLVLSPEYMLLDEPTSALDANTTDDFAEWLIELRDKTNFIIVTHDVLFAQKVASRGVYLSKGRILGTGKIDTIIDQIRGNNRSPDPAEND